MSKLSSLATKAHAQWVHDTERLQQDLRDQYPWLPSTAHDAVWQIALDNGATEGLAEVEQLYHAIITVIRFYDKEG